MNRPDVFIPNPEAAFSTAVSSLRREHARHTRGPWIVDEGNPWKSGSFNPDAYDPTAPFIPKGNLYLLENNNTKLIEDPFDIENLRIIEKERVIVLLMQLEEKAADSSFEGVVGMIGTGGTIASHEEQRTDGTRVRVAGLSVDYLLSRISGAVKEDYGIASMDFPTLMDSSQMEIDYNAELVIAMSYIWNNASENLKQKFNGFIIAHGTDTMSGSSSYAAMMLGPNCPFSVGFVGGQQDIDAPFTEARTNLENTFTSLSMLKKAGQQEKFVCMGGNAGGAYLTVGVEKVSDTLVKGFTSPSHPLLIDVSDFAAGGIRNRFFTEYSKILETAEKPPLSYAYFHDFRPVILRGYSPFIRIKPEEGDNPADYYDQIKANNRARAILLTTFGSFTANNKIRRAIMEAARETEKIVFAANPFPEGKDDHNYKDAVDLRESGVRVVAILPTALGAKITFASALFGDNPPLMAEFVADYNYVGEQPPERWQILQKRGSENQFRVGLRPEWTKILHSGKIA
ncbi:MAG TPA: asparaginase domain-containing protein [Candidatus Saccharimonadales bacterium]|nr:asparaginase domain-containing protein [Candidatus Saccharimonadales bacterium]